MWLMAKFLPQSGFIIPHSTLLGWLVLLAGYMLLLSGIITISRRRTTVRPGKNSLPKATVLVTTGVYQYTRNPVYLGMTIMLVAWAIFLENAVSIAGIILFVAFITKYQIIPEENALGEIFGEAYTQYKKRVRRWI